MSKIFEKKVKVTQVITLNVQKTRALEDPLRIAMLDLLSERPMSVEELAKRLKRFGKRYSKAPTTIRHHLDILKKSGLIELVRVEEARGAVLKYYASKAKFLGYEVSHDFEEKLSDAIKYSANQLLQLISRLAKEYKPLIKESAVKLKPCPYCYSRHFEEYIVLEILQRAMAEIVNKPEFLIRFRSYFE